MVSLVKRAPRPFGSLFQYMFTSAKGNKNKCRQLDVDRVKSRQHWGPCPMSLPTPLFPRFSLVLACSALELATNGDTKPSQLHSNEVTDLTWPYVVCGRIAG